MNLPDRQRLLQIYGEYRKSGKRMEHLAQRFAEVYQQEQAEYFSAPGRTELIGNHTDHQGGKVLAASIELDTVGAAYPNGTRSVRITSEGYEKEIVVDLSDLRKDCGNPGTQGLVAGMMEGMQKAGFQVKGFDAYISTNVIPAAGVSSSASFEMLICTIVNCFFNNQKMTETDYARIGQYAENTYWHKASGMMDQMACAVGGVVLLDFSDRECPGFEKVPVLFQDMGYQLVIVNTGKGHADLSDAYSDIPAEMKEAAAVMGVERLRETNLEEFLTKCGEIKNDRAVLRALHFFQENARVEQAAEAIRKKDWNLLTELIRQSGQSSWELLQNCYDVRDVHEQKVPRALALSELFLKKIGAGVCRVHGGGFAGVILCLVPQTEAEHYMQFISKYVGKKHIYPMKIRNVGAVSI